MIKRLVDLFCKPFLCLYLCQLLGGGLVCNYLLISELI